MLFEHLQPVAAGHFQCDRSVRYLHPDSTRQGALRYVTLGRGTLRQGPWTQPFERGTLFAIPQGLPVTMECSEGALGYYFAHFEPLPECAASALAWPWDLGPGVALAADQAPIVTAPFRAEVASLFRQLQYELTGRKACGPTAARAHLLLLGATFGRLAGAALAPVARPSGRLARCVPEPVAQVLDYVEEHIGHELSLAELARIARYSERRLVQLFRQALGRSPMAYVRERRIREAQRLLGKGGLSVKEVSGRLNFSDPQHFSRVFRQETGISPSEYASGAVPPRQRESGMYASA